MVMGVEQLKVEDRILLHLYNYIRFADDYEVPSAMSQKGIGEAVWIAWSNVPRAMKRLREQDLAAEEETDRAIGEAEAAAADCTAARSAVAVAEADINKSPTIRPRSTVNRPASFSIRGSRKTGSARCECSFAM